MGVWVCVRERVCVGVWVCVIDSVVGVWVCVRVCVGVWVCEGVWVYGCV